MIPWLHGRFSEAPLSVEDVQVHTIKEPSGDDRWLQQLPYSLKFHRKGVSQAQDRLRAAVFKKRREDADVLDEERLTDLLFLYNDEHDRAVHVTQEMANLYIGQGTNVRMWNMCLQPEKPRVQIDLAPMEAGKRVEAQQQFELIIDKAAEQRIVGGLLLNHPPPNRDRQLRCLG